MLAVIALPALLPIVALLQLLFPSMLRDQARHYRCAVQALLTQSTLICAHWAIVRWVYSEPTPWLSNEALWFALAAVALVGLLFSIKRHRAEPAETSFATRPPVSLEFWALGSMAVLGLLWGAWTVWSGAAPWDQMAVVTAASLGGLAHLVVRSIKAAWGIRRGVVTTEMVFLATQVIVGVLLGMYLNATPENLRAGATGGDWPTFRGNFERTGTVEATDVGPRRPKLLWTFDPAETQGLLMIHSSPTVVGNQVYVGALNAVGSLTHGRVYCISAGGEGVPPAGERIWRFTADGSLKAVFSSPTVVAGRLYIGEGYHQDQHCRMLCIDARDASEVLWTQLTRSHVESSATVVDGRVYFGAGDDGVWCLEPSLDGTGDPKIVWKFPGLHVDSSCAVAEGKVFAGSVLGDEFREFAAIAIDSQTGRLAWRVDAPLPVPAAPAYRDGRVFFALGNGKLNVDADQPAGRIWCLAAADGKQLWEFAAENSILESPACVQGVVYFCSRDQHCYAVDEMNGKLLWKRDLEQPIVASPVVAAGKVYVQNTGGAVFCLSAADGQELWRFDDIEAESFDAYACPTLAGGRLYVACNGKVYCLGDLP